MEISIKKLQKSEIEITTEVPWATIEPFMLKAANAISKDLKIPGFRPGKAPVDVVSKQVGSDRVLEEAINKALPDIYVNIVKEKKLEAIGRPAVTITKAAVGNPVGIKIKTAMLPQVTLPKLSDINAKRKKVTVSDETFNKALEYLRKRQATKKAVLRPAKKGDYLEIDFKGMQNGVPFDGGTAQNHPLTLGETSLIPGFEDQLLGMTTGDEKTFSITFPKDYQAKHMAGKEAAFEIKIKKVEEITMPEVTDEFAKKVPGDYPSANAFKKALRESLTNEEEQREEDRFQLEVLDAISQQMKVEIPEVLIEGEIEKMLHELEHELSHQGVKMDDYLRQLKKTKDDFKVGQREAALRRIKTGLILRQYANTHHIEVTTTEVDTEIQKQLKMYEKTPDLANIKSQFESAAHQENIRAMIWHKRIIKAMLAEVEGKMQTAQNNKAKA